MVHAPAQSIAKLGAAALLVNASALAAPLALSIVPAAPRYQEAVVARIARPPLDLGVIYGATTTMEGNTIAVTYFEYPELSTSSHDVSLGQLPAGRYTVTLRRHGSDAIDATAQFTVAPSAAPAPLYSGGVQVPSVNFTGQWWDADEPGWGLALAQGPTNLVFAEWFVYDASGTPVWYTLEPGAWTSAETFMTFEGPVFRNTGTSWAAPGPHTAGAVPAGTGMLSFRDAYRGTLNFVIDGVRAIKPITRLPIE